MARPRSTIYVAIGAGAFIVAAALVFLVLRNNTDNGSTSSTTTTSTTAVAGPTQGTVPGATAAPPPALPIPEGKQAVAIKVAFVPAGAGFVHQGDNVDIFGTIKAAKVNNVDPPQAKLILSNVKVLSVGGGAGADVIYLLALDANQAEQVIYLTTFESIYVSLVPKDAPAATTTGRSAKNLL